MAVELNSCEAGSESPVLNSCTSDGRVRVFARVRPPTAQCNSGLNQAVQLDEHCSIVQVFTDTSSFRRQTTSDGGNVEGRTFAFDGVFPAGASQERVFADVASPVLSDYLRGFNGTIFAYGQTGSGKTHSLLQHGQQQDKGLLPRIVDFLFTRIGEDAEHCIDLEACAIQVYNEQIDDLLHHGHQSGKGNNLCIQSNGSIPGLTWIACSTPQQMMSLFLQARTNLVYAESRLNKASSRSHAIFQIRFTKRPVNKLGDYTCARLSIVDLAGSERVRKSGVEGIHFREATAINKSLLALGNVVSALAAKKHHVPFRDSKLTRILEGSIGGNCKTVLLVCASPLMEHANETLNSMDFASRAMQIEVNAHANTCVMGIEPNGLVDRNLFEQAVADSCCVALRRAEQAEALAQHALREAAQRADQSASNQQSCADALARVAQAEARALQAEEVAATLRERADAAVMELEQIKLQVSTCKANADELQARVERSESQCKILENKLFRQAGELQATAAALAEATSIHKDLLQDNESLKIKADEYEQHAVAVVACLNQRTEELKHLATANQELMNARQHQMEAETEITRLRQQLATALLSNESSRDAMNNDIAGLIEITRSAEAKCNDVFMGDIPSNQVPLSAGNTIADSASCLASDNIGAQRRPLEDQMYMRRGEGAHGNARWSPMHRPEGETSFRAQGGSTAAPAVGTTRRRDVYRTGDVTLSKTREDDARMIAEQSKLIESQRHELCRKINEIEDLQQKLLRRGCPDRRWKLPKIQTCPNANQTQSQPLIDGETCSKTRSLSAEHSLLPSNTGEHQKPLKRSRSTASSTHIVVPIPCMRSRSPTPGLHV